jgi:predicted metalloprotease
MTFNENVELDTSQVSGGSGAGGGGSFPGGLQVGGGIGGLILLVLTFIFGGNAIGGADTSDPGVQQPGRSSPLNPSQVGAGGSQPASDFAECKTGADANRNDQCLVIATVNSVQAYWAQTLPQYGKRYTMANTVLYSGQTQSACGTASNQVGPFYCPLDKLVYIDASFFQELATRFGAGGGQLAKEYVIAHEYGHHVQDILGLLGQAQRDPQGPESGSVRLELMADCLAGTWSSTRRRRRTPTAPPTSSRSPGRTSAQRSPPPPPWETTASRRRPRVGSRRRRGPTAPAQLARSGSRRATPAVTSTSATPSGAPTPGEPDSRADQPGSRAGQPGRSTPRIADGPG